MPLDGHGILYSMNRVGAESQPLTFQTLNYSLVPKSEPISPPVADREQLERDAMKGLVAADIYLSAGFENVFEKVSFGTSLTLYRNDPARLVQPEGLTNAFPAILDPGEKEDVRQKYRLGKDDKLEVWISSQHMGVFIGLGINSEPNDIDSAPVMRRPDLEPLVLEALAYGKIEAIKKTS